MLLFLLLLFGSFYTYSNEKMLFPLRLFSSVFDKMILDPEKSYYIQCSSLLVWGYSFQSQESIRFMLCVFACYFFRTII